MEITEKIQNVHAYSHYQEVWKNNKSSARFMISWFGMTMIEREIVLHQWIMYIDS